MDEIFKALNDPTRRALLDSLRVRDGQSLTDLSSRLSMTRFGVMKHLKQLEDANLITTTRKGRFKHHFLNALPLQEIIDRWIEPLLAKPATRSMINLKRNLERTETMLDTKKPDFRMQTYIRCTQDALWNALTSADASRNFHPFAPVAVRDGASMIYRMPDGSDMLTCRETLKTPKTRIEAEFIPHWAPDIPVSRFVWEIEPQAEFCRLTLEHYDIPAGGERYVEGWERLVSGLKSWLETGTPARIGGVSQ